MIIVLSFEADLSDRAVKRRVVNKGCSYLWTIVFYERLSAFTQSVTSSEALIASV